MEIWKSIEDYPNYEVSSEGNVKNKKRDKLLSQELVKGYPRVMLCEKGTCSPKTVHRLVAEAFHGGKHNNLQVNHIDGNKENNNKDNLEWVTGSENIKHSYQYGLRKPPCPNPKKVQIVETGEIFESASSCARSINGLKSHVCECIKGERATHKGYHFKEIL